MQLTFSFFLDQPKTSLDEADKLLVSHTEEDKKVDDIKDLEEPIAAVLDEPQNGEKPDAAVPAAVNATDDTASKNVNSGQVSIE